MARKKGAVATAAARELALMRWRNVSIVDKRIFMKEIVRAGKKRQKKTQDSENSSDSS
jgi:hypothetical protein